jgi:hypothetical protein
MNECKRVHVSGTIQIPLPPSEAFAFFTPTGERAWAEGWNPRLPAVVGDETKPGTVFQTDHGGHQTTWIVVRREPG